MKVIKLNEGGILKQGSSMMLAILKLFSEVPRVSYVIIVVFALVDCARGDVAGDPAPVFGVTATVGVANFIGVSEICLAASASVASVNLNHDLIDLVKLRFGGVERLRSLFISGDTRDVSANSI
jgi:hypothetical protein